VGGVGPCTRGDRALASADVVGASGHADRGRSLGATLGEQLVPELAAADERHKPLFS
jgi:hypothetical protein